ncbi:MAG: SpoIID/LytB domain-containing protein [Planctomycetota bacterium]
MMRGTVQFAGLVTSLVAGLVLCMRTASADAVPKEPSVRVHLRSYAKWERMVVTGKGQLRVNGAPAAQELKLVRAKDAVLLDGRRYERLAIEASKGVFQLGSAPSRGRAYAGTLVVDKGRFVTTVPLENYVLGVLRGEIPLKVVPLEAARAQAIAVRSYTMHYLDQKRPFADVDDTTLFQVYAGLRYASQDKILRKGVQTTRGRYLQWENKPLKAFYHSTCGGHTTDVPTGLDRENVGCMEGVPCNFCKASKYYRWNATLSEASVLRATRLSGRLRAVKILEKGPGGRVLRVEIETTKAKREMHANELRLSIGPSKIRSTRWLSTDASPAGLRIEGAGWGHGVGMCQMGAMGRAAAGQTAEEILGVYYVGAKIVTAY